MKLYSWMLILLSSLTVLSGCATTDNNTPSFQPHPTANVSSNIADQVNRW